MNKISEFLDNIEYFKDFKWEKIWLVYDKNKKILKFFNNENVIFFLIYFFINCLFF